MKQSKEYIYIYPHTKAALFHMLNNRNGCSQNFDSGDYLVDIKDEDRFFLGIARGGHGGGYWYVAKVEKASGQLFIRGNIVYNPDESGISQSTPLTLRDKISTALLCIFLLPLLILVWLFQSFGNLFCWIFKKKKLWLTDEEALDNFMITYLGCKKSGRRLPIS